MASKRTKFDPPPKGWPLNMQDILQERVEFEDRIRYRYQQPTPIPAYKPIPSGKWTPAPAHTFWAQITRQLKRIMP